MRRTVVAAFPCLVAALAAPAAAPAQAALATDLWRVPAGTLAVPAPFAAGASAALWTPATVIPGDERGIRLAMETVNPPPETDLTGVIASASASLPRLGTVSLLYGRLGLNDIPRTETSPEAVGGAIPVWAQVISLGIARQLLGGTVVAGAAWRSLTARLDSDWESRRALDIGASFSGIPHLVVAGSTRFLDPLSGSGRSGTVYSAAVSLRSAPLPAVGTTADLAVRYGVTWARGEDAAELVSVGVALGGAVEVDAGAARERVAGHPLWRSRFGAALNAGRYRVYVGRDGGVDGFGATYRFGIAVTVR